MIASILCAVMILVRFLVKLVSADQMMVIVLCNLVIKCRENQVSRIEDYGAMNKGFVVYLLILIGDAFG